MTALPRIPTPPRLRWLAFCTEKLPFVVFALGVIAVAALWNQSTSPTLVAEAESVSAEVRSAHAGTLVSLEVAPLQSVTAGQLIARVQTIDPKILAASLAVIRAEIELMRADRDPVLPAQRIAIDASRLQLDWMRERVTLVALRMHLQQAESELARLTPLHQKKIVADELFETARLQRESFAGQVAEQNRLVETLAPAAREWAAQRAGATPRSVGATLAAALRVQEEKLRLTEAQLGPTLLTAPLAGVVTQIHRRSGETIAAGEPLVTVAATAPTHVIGFIRQPLTLDPQRGMTVEIRTRTPARRTAAAPIVEVGRVLEPVSPTVLALLNRGTTPELGLRILIAAPAALNLRPGEQVDVTFRN